MMDTSVDSTAILAPLPTLASQAIPAATGDDLRVVVVQDLGALQQHAHHWNALTGDVPFRRYEWIEPWWRHYATARDRLWTLLVFDPHEQLLGIAPWHLERSGRHGRVVRFLGSGEVCSDYLSLLCLPGHAQAIGRRIADWLADEACGQWDLLDLSGIEAKTPSIDALARRLTERGHVVDVHADVNCWRTELPIDWEAFLARLSKSRRERTRALLRRAIDVGHAAVHEVRTAVDLEHAFPILVELHQRRRASLAQPGCFASQRFTQFHAEVARRFLVDGRLRMLWTEWEGRPAAVEYGFVGGDVVYYYQGGFEPDLSDERPGWLAFAASLKLAIEQGYRQYDFLRGDELYKASWQAQPRPLVRLRAAGRPAVARLRHAAWRAGAEIKSLARQFLNRARG